VIDIKTGGHGGAAHHAGYTLPTAAKGAEAGGHGSSAAAAPAAFDAAKVVAAVASGNVDTGKAVFKKCAACHTTESGGANKTGPNLHAVVGRKMGSIGGFGGYSDEMKAKGGNWDLATLATFLHDPKGFVAKTKMSFAGVKDAAELANLLAFLGTLK
jgi:cytochrome c